MKMNLFIDAIARSFDKQPSLIDNLAVETDNKVIPIIEQLRDRIAPMLPAKS